MAPIGLTSGGSPKDLLRVRAGLLAKIREFFANRGLMEVDVPVIGPSTVSDPHIESLSLILGGKAYFLQSSPEYFIKKLLAQGCDSLYYLGKAFRCEELGSRHNPEFTMLEWYRLGFSDTELMQEVSELFSFLKLDISMQRFTYAQVFETWVGVDPHGASVEQLRDLAKQLLDVTWAEDDKNFWLDLLFTHLVEPKLQAPTIVYDYPASQAALAKIGLDVMGQEVAKRFEVYWQGIELGNAYWELTDADELYRRFSEDNKKRQAMGKNPIALDKKFLRAHQDGLPECAGIAMGVDRLLMCIIGAKNIRDVMPFAFSNF